MPGLDDFLQKIAQRIADAADQALGEPPAKSPPPRYEPAPAEVVEAEVIEIGEGPLSERKSNLGEQLQQHEAAFEHQVHETFAHKLGSLPSESDETARQKQPNLAAEVAAMFRSPRDVKKIFIASEVLKRPHWD